MSNNIINFNQYKNNKIIKKELVESSRTPLYESHLTGDNFSDRLTRIRESLIKINMLMKELKKLSPESSNDTNFKQSID